VPGKENVVLGPLASVPEKEILTIESLDDPGATGSLYITMSWFQLEYASSIMIIDISLIKIPEVLVEAIPT
jgi:hypothetical protein